MSNMTFDDFESAFRTLEDVLFSVEVTEQNFPKFLEVLSRLSLVKNMLYSFRMDQAKERIKPQ